MPRSAWAGEHHGHMVPVEASAAQKPSTASQDGMPNSAIASAKMVAPEFQITNESTVVGYVNYMQNVVSRGVGDVRADYSAVLPLADTAGALVDELNLLLAAGQLSDATVALITDAIGSMPLGRDGARRNRLYAALVLVLAAPEFLIQK